MQTEILWWITAFELPAFAGIFWMIWKSKSESQQYNDHVMALLEKRTIELRESLGNYKLEVAQNYITHDEVRELEARIVSHLLRIEAKLDTTALKTESLKARSTAQTKRG